MPEDEKARFCPNCGASVSIPPSEYEVKAKARGRVEPLRAGITGISFHNRLLAMIVALSICFAATLVGTLYPIGFQEADEIVKDTSRLGDLIQYMGVPIIFGNNLMYCMIMFIPFLGPLYGVYVLFSTGRVIAAIGVVSKVNPLLLLLTTFIFPFAWLEYISYAIAISESFWLTLMLIRHRFKSELASTAKAISLCALLLLVAAFIEMIVIYSA